jgi:hypothetical protein
MVNYRTELQYSDEVLLFAHACSLYLHQQVTLITSELIMIVCLFKTAAAAAAPPTTTTTTADR